MNLFNRIVLVTLCISLVVAAVAIIVLTWTIPNRSVNWLVDAAEWVDANDGDLEKALLTTISAFVGLLATIVLLIELIPRSGPNVQVTDVNSGNATLSTAAIGQRIEEAVCQVPNVVEVRADVKSKKQGVIVSLDLHVDPEANLATVTDEACQTAQEVLTERVHVALLRPPTARLHYRELRLQRGGNARQRAGRRPASAPGTGAIETAEEDAGVAQAETHSAVAVAEPPEPPELPEHLKHRDQELPADDDAAANNGQADDTSDTGEKTT